MVAPQGFFSGSAGMDASSKLPWLPVDFIGKIRIDVCKGIPKVRKTNAPGFVCEFTILSSNLPDVHVGGRYSWFQNITEISTAYPAIIGLLYPCIGLNPAKDRAKIEVEVKPRQDEWLNRMISDEQIAAGAIIMVQTSNKPTKAGRDYTLHAFNLPEETQVA
jgi:hypothetical protein